MNCLLSMIMIFVLIGFSGKILLFLFLLFNDGNIFPNRAFLHSFGLEGNQIFLNFIIDLPRIFGSGFSLEMVHLKDDFVVILLGPTFLL
jgi:hypothetical protein